MDLKQLYHVEKEDLPQLQALLTECFRKDPLYHALIPDAKIREQLLPELFECDLLEYFNHCDIYADSPEINGIIIVSDETHASDLMHYYYEKIVALLRTDHYLIKEDPSLKTLYHFLVGKDYLNSKWTDTLDNDQRLHIIYLAVRPLMQHKGIVGLLLGEVLQYANDNHYMVTLETHNSNNLPLYYHYGFQLYDRIEKHFRLVQYCLIRQTPMEQKI